MHPAVRGELQRFGLMAAAALWLGYSLGRPWLLLVMFLLGYLLWWLLSLNRLAHWLFSNSPKAPPDALGIWEVISNKIYQRQQSYRKQNKQLQEVLQRARRTTEAMPDGIVLLNRFHQVEWWNPKAEQLLGLNVRSDRGQVITNLIRHPDFVSYFRQKRCDERCEINAPRQMEQRLEFQLSEVSSGEHLIVLRDVTQLRKLEKMRQDFVSNVSHEIRTPLTVLNGYLETLLDNRDAAPPAWQRPLQQMQRQSQRLNNLVSDLLALAKLESQDLHADKVPLYPLLQVIAEDARLLSGDKHQRITLSCPDDLELYGNERELHSAFSNLVINAVKYGKQDGHIQVAWHTGPQECRLSVEDDGPGFDPKHIPRLTERFYRVDDSRNSESGGTGLGLAIVKHVLLRHQGYLEIHTSPGQGARFECVFPAAIVHSSRQSTG